MSAKITITNDELEVHLKEQLSFLELSSDAFDNGHDGEAKRLAVTIRVLVHDTNASRSLLGQLGRLQSQKFVDTAFPQVPGTFGTYSGLLSISTAGATAKYTPHLDHTLSTTQKIPFTEWWEKQPVFIDGSKRKISRKDLVLTAANQDGGAHIDPALNETYAELAKKNSLEWFSGAIDESLSPIPAPERAAIRQIAHEILKTLKPGYAKNNPQQGLSIAGIGFLINTEPPKKDAPK